MGVLQELIKLNQSVYGGNIVDFFKENSLFMYNKYRYSDIDCQSVGVKDMLVGGFYFLHYKDKSNWMSYSPVFCVDYKKVDTNLSILLCVNFNFIPIEIRSMIFDKYINEEQISKNSVIEVDFKGIYSILIRYGFEYSIVEYSINKIKMVHRINLNILPRFLYSAHPVNKYDPNKLIEIWNSKLANREKRHQEMITSLLSEFYDVNNDISSKYDQLKGHIQRLRNNL